MNQLDQATQFWIDQGGGANDQAIQGNIEMRRAAQQQPSAPEVSYEDDECYAAASQAAHEVGNRDADRRDLDESREFEDALKGRYDASIDTIARTYLAWGKAFKENPVAARESWIRSRSAQSPFKRRAAKVQEDKPHPDLTEQARHEWALEADVRAGVRDAARNRQEEEAYKNLAPLRAQIREQTGLSWTDFLRHVNEIDELATQDPWMTGNKLFMMAGGASTPAQNAEFQAQAERAAFEQAQRQQALDAHQQELAAQREQKVAAIGNWLTELGQQGLLPADYGQLEDEIGTVLMEMNAKGLRTGNIGEDLNTAIQAARIIKHEMRENAKAAASKKARNASRSISGGPAPGARRSGGYQSGSYDDLEDDVRAAMGGV